MYDIAIGRSCGSQTVGAPKRIAGSFDVLPHICTKLKTTPTSVICWHRVGLVCSKQKLQKTTNNYLLAKHKAKDLWHISWLDDDDCCDW